MIRIYDLRGLAGLVFGASGVLNLILWGQLTYTSGNYGSGEGLVQVCRVSRSSFHGSWFKRTQGLGFKVQGFGCF